MKLKTTILFVIALFVAQFVSAQQWQFVGPRAMGMGGAGVATAYGPDAQYWNPAGLASEEERNEAGLLIGVGATLETTGRVLEAVDDLADMSHRYNDLKSVINSGGIPSADNIATIFEGLNDISAFIENDMGVLANGDAGIGFKFKNFAISSRAIGTGAVRPVIDKYNIRFYSGSNYLTLDSGTVAPSDPTNLSTAGALAAAIDANGLLAGLNNLLGTSYANSTLMANALINAAASYGIDPNKIASAINTAIEDMPGAANIINLYGSASGSYKDNETLAMGEVASFGELSLGYGAKVMKGIKIGGNVKLVSGYTAETGVMLLTDNDDFKDIINKAYDNKKNTNTWALDLGALVNFAELTGKDIWWNPQVGVTARNINGPKFDRPDMPAGTAAAIATEWNSDKYQLKPQVRAGVSVNPKNWMTLAADIDVTENDTLLNGIKSRQLALGMEINLVNGSKFNMPLRLGYNKNLAESSLCPFYTAGIGFNMLHFFVELAGAVSTKTSKVDGNTVPNSAAASLTIGFLF